jgi:hypothetical protein
MLMVVHPLGPQLVPLATHVKPSPQSASTVQPPCQTGAQVPTSLHASPTHAVSLSWRQRMPGEQSLSAWQSAGAQ